MFVPILIAILLITGACVHKYMHQNDSAPEQLVEEILKVEGVNIDFSEKDKLKEQDNNVEQK